MKQYVDATVIFRESGEVVVQLRQGEKSWAHNYGSDAAGCRAASGDVWSAVVDGSFADYWDHDPEALEVSQTEAGAVVARFSSARQMVKYAKVTPAEGRTAAMSHFIAEIQTAP